jgi:hypothetical protein
MRQQISLRLDEETARQLKVRSTIEGRSINEIVNTAIAEYAESYPVSREDMLALVRVIAKEDAAILEALAKA